MCVLSHNFIVGRSTVGVIVGIIALKWSSTVIDFGK